MHVEPQRGVRKPARVPKIQARKECAGKAAGQTSVVGICVNLQERLSTFSAVCCASTLRCSHCSPICAQVPESKTAMATWTRSSATHIYPYIYMPICLYTSIHIFMLIYPSTYEVTPLIKCSTPIDLICRISYYNWNKEQIVTNPLCQSTNQEQQEFVSSGFHMSSIHQYEPSVRVLSIVNIF